MPVWIRRGFHRRICVANGYSERSPNRKWICVSVNLNDEAPSGVKFLLQRKEQKLRCINWFGKFP